MITVFLGLIFLVLVLIAHYIYKTAEMIYSLGQDLKRDNTETILLLRGIKSILLKDKR